MKKFILGIVIAIFGALFIYGIYYLNSPINSMDAKMTVYEDAVTAEAIFVRDEEIYTSDVFGTVFNHFSEGDRVSKGALVSTVYSGRVEDTIMQELKTIDKKIQNIVKSGEYNQISGTESVSDEIIIDEYKQKIIDAGITGAIPSISIYKDVINGIRSGDGIQNEQSIIAGLEREKEAVERRIGVEKYVLYADKAGIFTTVLDGLEEYLTPERAIEMGVDDFEAVSVTESEAVGNTIDAGASICKISNNHEWYVLVCVDAESMEEYDVGDRVQMRFDNIPGEQIECKITNKSEEQDGKVVVMLVSNYYLEGVYSFRQSTATIIFDSYVGYKIPIHALRNENNVQGVLGEKSNEQKFYPCKVLYTNTEEDFAIIDDIEGKNDIAGLDRIVVGER